MRKILLSVLLGGAMLLGACGGPTVQDAANQAASAIAEPTTAAAIDQAASAIAEPTTAAAIDQAASAVTGPDAATAVASAADMLTAAADDVTIEQGQALVLDATKSAGDIKDYRWTIEAAPPGAESVVGQTIMEGSSGNVSLEPNDYLKYFPKPGEYTVRLTVINASGASTFDDFAVNVP